MDNEEILRLKKELEESKQKNIELQGKIMELEDRKKEAEDNLARIKGSKAYKLSKPLRYVRSQVKRVTQYGSISAVNKKIKSKQKLKKRYVELGTGSFPNAERRALEEGKNYDKKVTISILVPLYNTPENFLREMIDSVVTQTYKDWELCLADGSDNEHSFVGDICKDYANKDSRIKYEKLEKNEGISGNTNACYKMATGEYIGLFDHDDVLHPSVLYKYREAIDEGADYIYCDEATFTDGNLNNMITVHFKPDFAIDNLRANNYICHFSVFKKELLNETELFRTEYDGSQDHDMILRLTGLAKKVEHIPGIYYYWRAHAGSVASNINAKTYAIDAAKRAVADHLKNQNIYNTSITSSRAFETIFRLKYDITGNPLVSIIVDGDTAECIEAINNWNTYENIEIIKESEYEGNLDGLNEAAKRNRLAKNAKGDALLFINGDVIMQSPDYIRELLAIVMREDVGAAGGKIINDAGKIESAGIMIGIGKDRAAGPVHYGFDKNYIGYMGKLCYVQDVSALSKDAIMVKAVDFVNVGGFDEEYNEAFYDIDFCLKLRRKNLLNVFNPYAEAIGNNKPLIVCGSGGNFEKDLNRFKTTFASELEAGDPYYNKNLTLDELDYSIM